MAVKSPLVNYAGKIKELASADNPALNDTAKTSLIDGDEVIGRDSASTYNLIKTTWTNVKVFLKTYFDDVYWLKDGNTIGAKKTIGSVDNFDVGIITNNVERITVLKDGKVGIGTTAPQEKLHISGTGTQRLEIESEDGSSAVLKLTNTEGVYSLYTDTDKFSIYSNTLAAAVMTILNSGNIGIMTVAPASPLAVNRQADDGVIIDLEQADTVEGTISVSGTTVSYNAFVGSHYVQLKASQVEPPLGAVVISTGDLIPCEKNVVTKTEVTRAEAITIVTRAEAKEVVMVEVEDKDIIISETPVTTYEYDAATDTTTEVVTIVTVYGTKMVEKKQLKAGYFHDKTTDEFYKFNVGYSQKDENGVITYILTVKTVVPVPNKEYFVYCKSTTNAADSKVYGVWMGKMADNAEGHSFGKKNKPIYLIAQVGLYKIRVTDTNGNITNGDYLESSTREFEAQKQSLAGRKNSTIAKALVSVDWATEIADPVLGYKWKLIPIIF